MSRDEICASACVFLLVAGVYRSYPYEPMVDVHWPPTEAVASGTIYPEKLIEVHRPYLANFPRDINEDRVSDATKQAYNTIKTYLDFMNIPIGILDKMWYVPSGYVVWLKPWEIFQFQIFGADPVFAETIELQESRWLGINRGEFITRNKTVDRVCNIFGDPNSVRECRDRVLSRDSKAIARRSRSSRLRHCAPPVRCHRADPRHGAHIYRLALTQVQPRPSPCGPVRRATKQEQISADARRCTLMGGLWACQANTQGPVRRAVGFVPAQFYLRLSACICVSKLPFSASRALPLKFPVALGEANPHARPA
jgi:hypothetical protein